MDWVATFTGIRILHMHELLDAGRTQAEVAELFGVSANTIGRKVREKMNTKTIVKKLTEMLSRKLIKIMVNKKYVLIIHSL